MAETPMEEKTSKKLLAGEKIKSGLEHIHKKIGVYGWIALGLLILLLGTIAHYEGRDFRRYYNWPMFRPMYMHQQSDWMRDIDRDFQTMQRQMDAMRTRHQEIMRDIWGAPINSKATTTSIVSNGDFQYSVNTKDGKLDGFVSTSDATRTGLLLAQIKSLGLTVDQKDNKLFFSGDAEKLNELLKVLGK